MDTRFLLHGVTPGLVIPFTPNGETIDFEALRNCVEFAAQHGYRGVCVPGYLGEYQKLSEAERVAILQATVDQAHGRIAIVAPLYHPFPRIAAEMARSYQECGADAIAVNIPRSGALSNDDVQSYCETVCRAVSLPVLIQDRNPTGPTVGVDFCQRLLDVCPNFRYLKLEEPLMLFVAAKIAAIRQATSEAVGIVEGWNGLYALELKPYGICGVMPTLGLADIFQAVWDLEDAGEQEQALDLFQGVLPQLTFALQNMDLFLELERRLLIARRVIAAASARPLAFCADAQVLNRGQWLNERVIETCANPAGSGLNPQNMYSSIRHYQVNPENVGKIVRLAQEGYLPRVENNSGFVAFYVMQVDPASVATVAVFESQADMETSSRTVSDWVRENFAPLFPNPPLVTSGEVQAYRMKIAKTETQ